jgi:diguanylate cyclase (GGDEF)-like protein
MKRGTKGCLAASAVLAAALVFFATAPARATPPAPDNPDALIKVAESKSATNAQRLRVQQQLHARERSLSPSQRWRLKLLDAQTYTGEGHYELARPMIDDIIEHSNDAALRIRASSLLINILSITHQYEKAYTLVNRLTGELPNIKDPRLRADILSESSQMLGWAGQGDLAFKYAKLYEAELPAGNKCKAYAYEVSALLQQHKLISTDPLFKKTIDSCLLDKGVVYANSVRLGLAGLLLDEGNPSKAQSLLNAIASSVLKAGYQPHRAWLQTYQAKAWLQLGNLARAKQFALVALAAANQVDFSQQLLETYRVLYEVEKKAGNDGAALSWFEKYVKQNEATVDDTKTRVLAYQMATQEVIASKARADALGKQNRILQLDQSLASKATETTRLYALLLLLVIAFIALWMFRLKHSQLRFRRMARHDGLTNAFNRQHFLDEAGRTLLRLQKAGADACLVLLDLDHFKRVNDTYGHAAGDEVLRRAVAICRRELRASDVFGRLGGEEFGALMPGCVRAQGIEVATRIRRALTAAPMELSPDAVLTVSASFGLACTDASGYALSQLFTDADAALYRAKRGGRDQLVVGTGNDQQSVRA